MGKNDGLTGKFERSIARTYERKYTQNTDTK